jgi:hypothetical protein
VVGAYGLTDLLRDLLMAADDDIIIARPSRIPVTGILRTPQILVLVLPFVMAAASLVEPGTPWRNGSPNRTPLRRRHHQS